MGAGKTSWLIEKKEQLISGGADKLIVVKPKLDSRTKGGLWAHNGQRSVAVTVDHERPELILDEVKITRGKKVVVMIDETNFWNKKLIEVVEKILANGVSVYAAGLLLDSERSDFGPTRDLVEMADTAEQIYAKCDFEEKGKRCDIPAEFNFAKGKKEGQVRVGAFDFYGAACETHYEELKRRWTDGGPR